MNDNMTDFGAIGINHKTADVNIREKVALSEKEKTCIHAGLFKKWQVEGCILLSTCNRSEIYLYKQKLPLVIEEIKAWLDRYKKVSYFVDERITYTYFGWEAVEHFIHVISSIDSQIVGEPQITSQVKKAYKYAYKNGYTNMFINKLFDFSLSVQKKIRSDTFLNDGAVSVSFAAVELAKKIYSSLHDKHILLIGSGETAELAAKHFIQRGVASIYLANRTFSRAKSLAGKINGKAVPFGEIEHTLCDADIVLSATQSPDYIIHAEMMKRVNMKRNYRPLFLIDLAIPRDIDPQVKHLNGIFLYNLDDLKDIAENNLKTRYAEIPRVKKIIAENLAVFKSWYKKRCNALVIEKLKQYFESVREKEFNQLKNRFPREHWTDIDYLTKRIVNKLLHRHIKSLNECLDDPKLFNQNMNLLNDLYRLDLNKPDVGEDEHN